MNNKRIISIIAAGVMTLSLVTGCAKKAEAPAPAPTVETTTPAPAVTPAPEAKPEVYTASAPAYDERGWKGEIKITYTDNKITKVEYDEVNKDGKKKSADAAYTKAMKDAKGITPAEVYAKLSETALKDDKSIIVTGATVASKSFETLYAQAKGMKK